MHEKYFNLPDFYLANSQIACDFCPTVEFSKDMFNTWVADIFEEVYGKKNC